MISIRRIYIYFVVAVSLLGATSAVVALLQNLVPPGASLPVAVTALLIAVVVIAVPFFLGHWFWAQRLAMRDPDERGSLIRRIYLYAMLAILLGWILSNSYGLIVSLLRLSFGLVTPGLTFENPRPPLEIALDSAVALILLIPIWLFHELVARGDARAVPDAEQAPSVRRIYIYVFAAVGLVMTAFGIRELVRLILFHFPVLGFLSIQDKQTLVSEIARLVAGVPLWFIFWSWAQRLFFRDETERNSALRKLYLYLVVFFSALTAVSGATLILAGIIRSALGLSSVGDIRDPISIILVAVLVWGFHWFILRQETNLVEESERQAGLRRLYWYLVAAIGLGAFLIGLAGVVSVMIRAVTGEFFGDGLKEPFAWFSAALIAGLPVWFVPWARAQSLAVKDGEKGASERRSIVRKIYLYFYLLVATLTMLGCGIYILSRFLTLALGERAQADLRDIAYPLAYGMIAAAVWAYHGFVLRGDNSRYQAEQAARRAEFSIAIVDDGEAKFGRALVAELNRILPGVTIVPQGFENTGGASAESAGPAGAAKLIIGTWTALGTSALAAASTPGTARRLLVPVSTGGIEWVGVESTDASSLAQDAARAAKGIVEGENAQPRRGLHPVLILVLVLIGLCLLFWVISLALPLIMSRF